MIPNTDTLDQIISHTHAKPISDHEWKGKCPSHDDAHESFTVTMQPDGKIHIHCFAGCTGDSIVSSLGLQWQDLYPNENGKTNGKKPPAVLGAATVENLAIHTGLPVSYLEQYKLKNTTNRFGESEVFVPYYGEDRKAIRPRRRTAITGADKYKWGGESGTETSVYGLWKLNEARKAGYLIIVEGESDCWTLWNYGFHCIGVPGSTNCKTLERVQYHGIKKIFIFQENDPAGIKFPGEVKKHLDKTDFKGEIFIIKDQEYKDPNELHKQDAAHFKDRFQCAMDSASNNGEKKLIDCTISANDLMKLDIPPVEYVVGDFIPKGSLSMIYAPTKIGKTFLSLEMAISMSSGENFLEWETFGAKNVLYVEGDLPLIDIKTRITKLRRGKDISTLRILSSKYLFENKKSLFINEAKTQTEFDSYLKELKESGFIPEVIFFDNLSVLTSNDENDNNEQKSTILWLNGLRHQGIAVIQVHHSGKGGDQRGASKRLDQLDTVIKLTKPPVPKNQGAEFILEFEYTRGRRPTPDKLNCELIENSDGDLDWVTETRKQKAISKFDEAITNIYNEKIDSIDKLADSMQITQNYARQLKSQLIKKGWLDKNWLLTTEGQRQLLQDDSEVPF